MVYTYTESSLESRIEQYSKDGATYNLIGIIVSNDNNEEIVKRIYDNLIIENNIISLYKIHSFSRVPLEKEKLYTILERLAQKSETYEIKEWIELEKQIDSNFELEKSEIKKLYKIITKKKEYVEIYHLVETLNVPDRETIDDLFLWLLETKSPMNINYLLIDKRLLPSKSVMDEIYEYFAIEDPFYVAFFYEKTKADIEDDIIKIIYNNRKMYRSNIDVLKRLERLGIDVERIINESDALQQE